MKAPFGGDSTERWLMAGVMAGVMARVLKASPALKVEARAPATRTSPR